MLKMQVKIFQKNKKRRKHYDKKFSIFDTARNLAVFFYENGDWHIKNENFY